jgi:hypothetical protein
VNVNGAVSSIGTGSTTACTGSASRSTASGVKYILAVTYDGPLEGSYPKTANVTINAPTTTSIPNPRPCYPSDDVTNCTTDPQNVVCGFDLSCTLTQGDLDTYRFTAPVGAALAIKVCGDIYNRWCLYDPSRTELKCALAYDTAGPSTRAGTYSIQVQNASNRPNTYSLSMQGIAANHYGCAIPIFDGGQPTTSSFSSCADLDGYKFFATSGHRYTISITGQSGDRWWLYDPKGAFVASCYGTCQTPPLSTTGNYTIVADNYFGRVGSYTLSLNRIGGAGARMSTERLPETVITDDEKPPTKSPEALPMSPAE